MTLNLAQPQERASMGLMGGDNQRVFQNRAFRDGRILIPDHIHVLPDFRPPSEQACTEALSGVAPITAGEDRFDPLRGPWSETNLRLSSWAQSLEFLRDIKSATREGTSLSEAWVQEWLEVGSRHPEKSMPFFSSNHGSSSKTDRLIWRARRVLNCLSHVLPLLSTMPTALTSVFWCALLDDIAKIGAPTDTLWCSLKDGFDPLSPRAIWLRAAALLGVEAALPGLLQPALVDKSIDQIKASIQNDGLITGGSIIGTLSAGADLCMLGRIAQVEPILQLVRHALASLRHKDGTLVTFGAGAADYERLLTAVLGPGTWKPSALLLGSGIARVSAKDTSVWMRAPQTERTWGPLCEIEVAGGALLSNFGAENSGVLLDGPATVTQARCKRRDEQDSVVLEASAAINISGKCYNLMRQIRLANDGAHISGEDIIRPEPGVTESGVNQICFAIPETCTCHLSADKQSVLIVTSRQQAWRFRIQGMDILVELGSDTTQRNLLQLKRHVITCRCSHVHRQIDFRAVWQLVLEDLE